MPIMSFVFCHPMVVSVLPITSILPTRRAMAMAVTLISRHRTLAPTSIDSPISSWAVYHGETNELHRGVGRLVLNLPSKYIQRPKRRAIFWEPSWELKKHLSVGLPHVRAAAIIGMLTGWVEKWINHTIWQFFGK